MIQKDEILNWLQNAITDKDIFIVELSILTGNVVRLYIDKPQGIAIDDCTKISRLLEAELLTKTEDFELEVSSPGLLTPFKVAQQYTKNIGKQVEVLLKTGIKAVGKLTSFSNNTIEVEEEKKIKPEGKKKKEIVITKMSFNLDDIKTTKLIIKY